MRQLNGKVIVFDCDGVIAANNQGNYKDAKPYLHAIAHINKAYDLGYYIKIATARYGDREQGVLSKIYQRGFEEWVDWLTKYHVKYDEIIMGKPAGNLYVDDKACKVESDKGEEDWTYFWERVDHLEDVDKYNQSVPKEIEVEGEKLKGI